MSEAKDVVRRLEEAWAANDLATVDQLLAPDLVSHDAPPGMPPGREGARAAHQMAMTSFPDRQMTINEVIGDGDRVAVRTTIRGTNTGGVPWLGCRPTAARWKSSPSASTASRTAGRSSTGARTTWAG